MKAYKSLESYNHFVSGWVKHVAYMKIKNKSLVTAKVKHSQRMNDPPLKPWLVSEEDGSVVAAHCTCMAGLGEACSHVAALLFYVDATVRIRGTKTVTQEPAYWLIPNSVNKVDYSMVKDINFQSAKTMKKNLDQSIQSPQTPRRQISSQKLPNVPAPTSSEMSDFLLKLYNVGAKPVVLSVMPEYAKHYVPSCLGESYPAILSELYDEKCSDMAEEELRAHCVKIFDDIKVTKKQIENVEFCTRNQADSKEWFRFRTGRVTASRLKAVCVTKLEKPSKSLLQSICYPVTRKFTSKATQWGCEHESDAYDEYNEFMVQEHANFKIMKCGFIISEENPFIGASPDGLISCDCCGEGTVEIKCPYCVRDAKLEDSVDKIPCLEKNNGEIQLKKSHEYYYQVQTQIFVCNKDFCDFVVWTNSGMHIKRIEPDQQFWDVNLEKAKLFFTRVILPELVAKVSSRTQPNVVIDQAEPCNILTPNNSVLNVASGSTTDHDVQQSQDSVVEVICVCKVPYDPNFDRVIGCDNENCDLKWFHFTCLNLKRAPKGDWYCKQCRNLPQFKKKKTKKFEFSELLK